MTRDEANRILNLVRAGKGKALKPGIVNAALRTTGDLDDVEDLPPPERIWRRVGEWKPMRPGLARAEPFDGLFA